MTDLPSFAIPHRLPSSARWADEKHAVILARFSDGDHLVPDDPNNTQRMGIAEWEKRGSVIGAYFPPEAVS